MKLTCLQDNLKRALATVGHAVPSKSTLPVLSNILLAADDGRLTLSAPSTPRWSAWAKSSKRPSAATAPR